MGLGFISTAITISLSSRLINNAPPSLDHALRHESTTQASCTARGCRAVNKRPSYMFKSTPAVSFRGGYQLLHRGTELTAVQAPGPIGVQDLSRAHASALQRILGLCVGR